VTILRAGEVDDMERNLNTKPLQRTTRWWRSCGKVFYTRRDCVLLTGSNELSWHTLPNDERKEDLSVLMGAVFTKQFEPGKSNPGGLDNLLFKPIELEWILCIAADKEGAFNESHKSLMKCFNDGFWRAGECVPTAVRKNPGARWAAIISNKPPPYCGTLSGRRSPRRGQQVSTITNHTKFDGW